MAQLVKWSGDDGKKTLQKRLAYCKRFRRRFEVCWKENESILFQDAMFGANETGVSFNSLAELWQGEPQGGAGGAAISINYTFKYLRFLHAQMSANPPAVLPKPTSTDLEDRRAAQAADDLAGYSRRQYNLQEKQDLTTLSTLTYGTGVTRMKWDTLKGELIKVSKKTGAVTMTGDIAIRPLNIWDFWFDPDASLQEDIKYTFERHVLPLEEACFKFPKHRELLEENAGPKKDWQGDGIESSDDLAHLVEIYEYHEKGLPWNGMVGRHVFCLESGELLTEIEKNDYLDAQLPYHILTDVDVPNQVYGKTFLDYMVRLQDVLNRLDSTVLDAIEAHGSVRMVVYDAAEMQTDAVTNGNWEIMNIKGTAAQAPSFVNPPQMMPEMATFRAQLLSGMAELAGVTDEMTGQVNREMSSLSMQTAINAGNLTRRRLFNKYTLYVKNLYLDIFGLIKQHWSDERKIRVTGKEGAFGVAYYSAADLEGGFDLEVEYGTSFSLDPAARREEIIQLMPHLKEAGLSMRTILSMIRLNEVDGLVDKLEVAGRRQLELFDEMISTFEEDGILIYIAPQELEPHAEMLEAADTFRMSAVFKYLDPQLQALIDRHIKERMDWAAKAAAPDMQAPAPGPMPAGAMPDPAGMLPVA